MACLNELLGAGLVLATITFLSLPAQSKMGDFQIRRTRLFILLLTAILVVSFLNLAIEIHRSNGDPDFSVTLLTTIYTFPIIIQLDHLIFSESPEWRLCRLWWMAMMAIDSLDLLEDFRKPQPREQCFLYTVLASCVRWCLTLALFVIFHCDPRDRIVPGKDKRSTAQKRDRRLVDSIRSSGGILHWMHKFRIFLPWIVPQSPTEWAQLAMCILLGWCQTRLLQWNFELHESLFKGAAGPHSDILRTALRLCFVKFACSGCGLTALKRGISDHVTMNRSARAANDIYAFIMRHDASFHASVKSTELEASIDRGMGLLRAFDNLVLDILPGIYELISAVWTLLDTYGASVTMMLLYLYANTLVMTVRVEKMISPRLQAFGRAGNEGRRLMQNALAYWRTIRHCGQEAFEIGRFATVMDEQKALKAEYSILSFLGHLVTGLTELLEDAMALSIVVARGFEHHDDTLRNIATFWHVERLVRNPWHYLCVAFTSLLRSLLEADDLRRVLEIKPTMSYGSERLHCPRGNIVLNRICYYRPGSTSPFFYNLTLTCKGGKTTAFVGPSGSGKSTVLDLITRTRDPHGGDVTIGGQNLKDLKRGELEEACAYMFQNDPPFEDKSIRSNIGYACRKASIEEIESAAQRAGIHQDIMATEQGYEGTVGRGGEKFSGGQKQRIALARTLLPDREIVLLDEATSAQDQDTEKIIQQSIALLRDSGKTVVLVAHRLSTISEADEIIVFKRGSKGRTVVAESGRHKELLARRGEYARLWDSQTSTVGTKE